MEEARRISNSEVGTWLTCKAKYRFAFDMKLEKINKSGPVYIPDGTYMGKLYYFGTDKREAH